jgi:hypothetical protein
MPSMIRIPGKPKKIAYAILGRPANMNEKRTPQESKVNKRLIWEETIKVR